MNLAISKNPRSTRSRSAIVPSNNLYSSRKDTTNDQNIAVFDSSEEDEVVGSSNHTDLTPSSSKYFDFSETADQDVSALNRSVTTGNNNGVKRNDIAAADAAFDWLLQSNGHKPVRRSSYTSERSNPDRVSKSFSQFLHSERPSVFKQFHHNRSNILPDNHPEQFEHATARENFRRLSHNHHWSPLTSESKRFVGNYPEATYGANNPLKQMESLESPPIAKLHYNQHSPLQKQRSQSFSPGNMALRQELHLFIEELKLSDDGSGLRLVNTSNSSNDFSRTIGHNSPTLPPSKARNFIPGGLYYDKTVPGTSLETDTSIHRSYSNSFGLAHRMKPTDWQSIIGTESKKNTSIGLTPLTASSINNINPPMEFTKSPSKQQTQLFNKKPYHMIPELEDESIIQQLEQLSPLYIVEFKAGRADVFYCPEPQSAKIKTGDLVIVEADRGRDLGRVIDDNVKVQTVIQMKVEQLQIRQKLLHSQQANSDSSMNETINITPKQIFRLAQQSEISILPKKAQDEIQATMVCTAKIRQRGLPMEAVDSEYQWDRRKLTIFYRSTSRVDFRELVRDLFKIYKTRIWMCATTCKADKEESNQSNRNTNFAGVSPSFLDESNNEKGMSEPSESIITSTVPNRSTGFMKAFAASRIRSTDEPIEEEQESVTFENHRAVISKELKGRGNRRSSLPQGFWRSPAFSPQMPAKALASFQVATE